MIKEVIKGYFPKLIGCSLMKFGCKANYLPEGISDHCLAKINLPDSNDRIKRAFQYCNTWAQHPCRQCKIFGALI